MFLDQKNDRKDQTSFPSSIPGLSFWQVVMVGGEWFGQTAPIPRKVKLHLARALLMNPAPWIGLNTIFFRGFWWLIWMNFVDTLT